MLPTWATESQKGFAITTMMMMASVVRSTSKRALQHGCCCRRRLYSHAAEVRWVPQQLVSDSDNYGGGTLGAMGFVSLLLGANCLAIWCEVNNPNQRYVFLLEEERVFVYLWYSRQLVRPSEKLAHACLSFDNNDCAVIYKISQACADESNRTKKNSTGKHWPSLTKLRRFTI